VTVIIYVHQQQSTASSSAVAVAAGNDLQAATATVTLLYVNGYTTMAIMICRCCQLAVSLATQYYTQLPFSAALQHQMRVNSNLVTVIIYYRYYWHYQILNTKCAKEQQRQVSIVR